VRTLFGVLEALVGLAVALGVLSPQGSAAPVTLGAQLGWQGRPVPGAINPLTITVENATGKVLSGTLTVRGEQAAAWRASPQHTLRCPVLLAPGARGRFLFPWPLELRGPRVVVELDAGPAGLFQTQVSAGGGLGKLVALVGAPLPDPLPVEPLILLEPEDLPEEPALLTCFARVVVGPGVVLSPRAQAVLAAWGTYLGGQVEGLPVPLVWGGLSLAEAESFASLYGPRPAPRGLLVAVALGYILGLGYALPAWARGARPWGLAFVLGSGLGFALFYIVSYGVPESTVSVQTIIEVSTVPQFSYALCAVLGGTGGEWVAAGLWWSKDPGKSLTWEWTPQGPATRVRLDPGERLVVWTVGPGWQGEGRTIEVGLWPTPWLELPRPIRAAVSAFRPELRVGDVLQVREEHLRQGRASVHRLFVRWVRRYEG